jgi:ABC-type microcin C transport system permease subunit YejE
MKLSDKVLNIALLGMNDQADDIIDYVGICFSVLISILAGMVAAFWIGSVVGALVGLMAGIGVYGIGTLVCSFALLHHHRG